MARPRNRTEQAGDDVLRRYFAINVTVHFRAACVWFLGILTLAAPRPFVGPSPEYPPGLRKAKVKGEAMIRLQIRANGAVLDPQVRSASDPAFGEAALAAIRMWRFLPKVKDGRPVGTEAEMPFSFVYSPPRDGN